MAKLFENAPSNIFWSLIILGIVVSALYVDFIMGQTTNVVIFFIATVVVPVIIAGLVSRTEGHALDEMLGFRGDAIYAASMLLLSAGLVTFLFFLITRPLALIYIGTSIYKDLVVIFLPLSSQPFWLAAISPIFSFVFYLVIAVGEEIMKIFLWKNVANWISERRMPSSFAVLAGMLIGFLMWLSAHFISWGGLTILGIAVGIFLSIVFMAPYFLGEPILSPERGIQIATFSIWAPIGGHFMYDFLLSLFQDGLMATWSTTTGIMLGVVLTGLGGMLLVFKFVQTKTSLRLGIFR